MAYPLYRKFPITANRIYDWEEFFIIILIFVLPLCGDMV